MLYKHSKSTFSTSTNEITLITNFFRTPVQVNNNFLLKCKHIKSNDAHSGQNLMQIVMNKQLSHMFDGNP